MTDDVGISDIVGGVGSTTDRTPNDAFPVRALGAHIRALRQAAGLTSKALAEAAGLRRTQMSRIEQGANVEAEQYNRIAKALNYRDAGEMFMTPHDRILRRLHRMWPSLDEQARMDVLRRVKAMIDADRG